MSMVKFKEILAKIKEYNKIIIFTHMRADGDCTGSAVGLREMIKATFPEKNVYIAGEEAEYLRFLGDFDKLSDEEFVDALGISVDTAGQKRIADQRYSTCKELVRIDHHVHVESFGNIELIDTTRPACAQIVLEFFLHDPMLITSHLGLEGLYTGILTDTGRFRYRGTGSDTFRGVAQLIDLGLNFDRVHAELSKESENLIRFRGNLLLNYKKTAQGFAYYYVTEEMMNEFNVSTEEASSLVNELSVLEDCPVWALILEYKETNNLRVRLRSKGPVINEFCAKYDGGGHAMACGATLRDLEHMEEFIADVNNLVENYKK